MPASLHRLRTRPDRLRSDQAFQVRQLVLGLDGLPEPAVREIVAAIDRQTASNRGWTFVMLSPAQNASVVRWLGRHSTRPRIAVQLWAEMLCALRIDTGEVMLSRDQLASSVEARPAEVSEILSELERIGAITRSRQRVAGMRGPGRVSVYVSPLVATHLAGAARDRAQASAKPVDPVGCTGGKGAVRHLNLKARV